MLITGGYPRVAVPVVRVAGTGPSRTAHPGAPPAAAFLRPHLLPALPNALPDRIRAVPAW